MAGASNDPALSLALSPLLGPLRFASRAGVSRLKDLEPLVGRVVESARAFASGASAQGLDRIAAAVRGFDSADEPQRKGALAALVRELGALVPVPEEISTLGAAMSDPSGKLARMPEGQLPLVPSRSMHAPPAPARGPPAKASARAPADPLATPLLGLRGVGPAIAEKLSAKGLTTVEHLLLNLPRRYEDRRTPRTVAEAPVGERSVIAGRIVKAVEARGRRRRLEVLVRDDAGGTLVCIWFHFRPSLYERYKKAFLSHVLVSGDVREGYHGGGKVMHHPDVELLGTSGETAAVQDDDSFGRVVPVYSEVEGVPPRTFRRLQKRAVDEYARFVRDLLPEKVRKRRELLPLDEALREAHFPDKFAADLARGVPGGEPRRRLAFEELFLVQLGLALRRRGVKVEPGMSRRCRGL